MTSSKRPTIASLSAELAELKALIVAQGAPVKARAASPVGPVKFADTAFGAEMIAKRAGFIACELGHGAACNRSFSPASSGRTNHVARIV